MKVLASTGLTATRDLGEVAEIYDSFKDRRTRAAIRHVVRAVVDWRGQIVTMSDRAYLTEAMPMCVVWGRNDQVIPVRHARNAAQLAPSARIEIIPNAGHFPHKDHPQRFVKIVNDFVRATEPAVHERGRWRDLLEHGPDLVARQAEAGDAPVAPVHPLGSRTRTGAQVRRRRPPA
jgi:hypothetical protein